MAPSGPGGTPGGEGGQGGEPGPTGSTSTGGKPQEDVVEADYEIVDESKK